MKRLVLLLPLILGACGAVPAPEPIIKTVVTEVPVYTSCVPSNVRKAPAYSDSRDALLSAPDAAARYQLKIQGGRERDDRLAELEPVIAGCTKAH